MQTNAALPLRAGDVARGSARFAAEAEEKPAYTVYLTDGPKANQRPANILATREGPARQLDNRQVKRYTKYKY